MKKIKNIFGKVLIILFALFLTGSIYFVVFNQKQIDNTWANFFLFSGFSTFVIAVIYGRDNIRQHIKQGSFPANYRRTLLALVCLTVGGGIINLISQYIGGSLGFTIGLAWGACLLVGLFLFFKNGNK